MLSIIPLPVINYVIHVEREASGEHNRFNQEVRFLRDNKLATANAVLTVQKFD